MLYDASNTTDGKHSAMDDLAELIEKRVWEVLPRLALWLTAWKEFVIAFDIIPYVADQRWCARLCIRTAEWPAVYHIGWGGTASAALAALETGLNEGQKTPFDPNPVPDGAQLIDNNDFPPGDVMNHYPF